LEIDHMKIDLSARAKPANPFFFWWVKTIKTSWQPCWQKHSFRENTLGKWEKILFVYLTCLCI